MVEFDNLISCQQLRLMWVGTWLDLIACGLRDLANDGTPMSRSYDQLLLKDKKFLAA